MVNKNAIKKIFKSHFIFIIIILFIIFINVIYIFTRVNIKELNNNSVFEPDIIEQSNIEENKSESIFVDIKGAVVNPGVYEFESNSRVNDAIIKSGGLVKEADTSFINLSKKLTDEMVIIVYTKTEIRKMKEEEVVIKYIEKECNCPEITNDACIDDEKDNENTDSSDNKLSLNTATLEELQMLPGIGSSKALEIIEYRKQNNGFKSIEELMEISGIGSATFDKLKNLVKI